MSRSEFFCVGTIADNNFRSLPEHHLFTLLSFFVIYLLVGICMKTIITRDKVKCKRLAFFEKTITGSMMRLNNKHVDIKRLSLSSLLYH